MLNTPESLAKVREFCSFGYDQKYVDLAKECDDKENGKINLYYGAPLVLFVAYDKTACWTHPQRGAISAILQRILRQIIIWADIGSRFRRPVFITKYRMNRGK